MKQFFIFVRKEFLHVFRDPKSLLLLFGLPVVQIVLFGFALSNEVKNSKIGVLDFSRDVVSQALVNELEASSYFEVDESAHSMKEIDKLFRRGDIKAALIIPATFASDFTDGRQASLQFIADSSDPNQATTITNYFMSVAQLFQAERISRTAPALQISLETRMLYNPELKGAPNFVPGVISLVLMLVCVMMTSISIVREKERGTMEILLVSPFRPLGVILAKAVPYLIVSLVNLAVIILLSVYALELPVKGSLITLVSISTLYIITALSLGLLISTTTNSQQTAMLLSLMGMLLPTLLFAGFLFPIENMPVPLQLISNIVPAKWFYIIVKSVMIKGVGLSYVWKETLILLGMTLALLALALKKFNVRLA